MICFVVVVVVVVVVVGGTNALVLNIKGENHLCKKMCKSVLLFLGIEVYKV